MPNFNRFLKHICFLAFVCNITLAQEQEVVLPSPETAALFKYQEYPMDYSTGLPQISIPLFTLQNGSLSVPISISYHASGCKVADRDGPIAVGWSLSVGGMISRTINGSADFGDYGFPSPFDTSLFNNTDLATLERIMHFTSPWSSQGQWLDSEYDIFSYNFGGQSGKFLFEDNSGVKTPVFLPSNSLKITPDIDAVTGLNGIEVIDEIGNTYTFTGTESSNAGYTGYSLKRIVSANLNDTITYYNYSTPQYRKYVSQNIVIEDKWAASGPGVQINTNTNQVEHSEYYNISRVTEIDFVQGKLEFVTIGDSGDDKDLIDYIQLKDYNDSLIKKVKFNRDPLHTVNLSIGTTNFTTHKLSSIEIMDNNGSVVETYSLDYNASVYHTNSSGIIDPRYIDYWGYYNASGQSDMIYQPNIDTQTIENLSAISTITVGSSGANREPNLLAIKSGILNKITYPTGGSTSFTYELNKYKSLVDNLIKDGPGVRVKEIVNNDASGNTHTRTFHYGIEGNAESSYGNIDVEPLKELMRSGVRHKNYTMVSSPGSQLDDHRERTFYSNFLPSMSELSSRPIIYTSVTEYKGDSLNNVGKTVYEYDNYAWGRQNMGDISSGVEKWHIPNYKFWNTPKLKTQTDYKAIKNGSGLVTSYFEKRKISNTYAINTLPANDIIGLHVQRNYVFPQSSSGSTVMGSTDPNTFPEAFGAVVNNLPVYASIEYRIPTGTKNLTSTSELLTNDDGTTVSTLTSYLYNGHNYVSEVTTKTSKVKGALAENLVHKKSTTYPFDHSGTDVYDDMVALNMLRFRVEEIDSLDNQLLNTSYVQYQNWGSSLIKPDTIFGAKGNGALEPKVIFQAYDDKGNPQEISKENAPHTYYIWGYNGSQPIAKIDNFTDTQATGIQSLIDSAVAASDVDDDNCKAVSCKEQELREALILIQNNSALDNAQMTFFTYDPLVGATSMTDPRGYTIYYTYDDFNRLQEIRDADGNLVSDYDYSYKQPVSN